MRFLRFNNRRGGFTLVELLIVIIIIAVLAAVVIPKFINSGARSKEAALRSDLQLYRNAIDLFKTDTGAFPATLAALAATTAPGTGLDSAGASKSIVAADWRGPYIDAIMNDPVSGSAFTYSITPPVGKVSSSASGNDSQGNPFSGY